MTRNSDGAPDDRMDWDSTDQHLTRGTLTYNTDTLTLRDDLSDPGLDIHVYGSTVHLHVRDMAGDDDRMAALEIDVGGIDDLIQQLIVAKEYADNNQDADIRVSKR